MMTLRWLGVAALLLVSTVSSALPTLGVTADVTWASKYMTDGFKIGGDNPVVQPSVSIQTPVSGLSAMFWTSYQLNRENNRYDELDLFARYSHDFFSDSQLTLNFHGFYDFYYYPEFTSPGGHMQGNKLSAGLSLPKAIPIWDSYLVPTYNLYYWVYWADNQRDLYEGGAHHELALQYFRDFAKWVPGTKGEYAGLIGTLNYNDGAFGVSPGFSHTTLGLACGVYAFDSIIGLSVNRQWTYQPTVDSQDELWTTFSFTKTF